MKGRKEATNDEIKEQIQSKEKRKRGTDEAIKGRKIKRMHGKK